MRLQAAVIGTLLVGIHVHAARAQGDVASLIAAARANLEQFNPDSASAFLERALAPNSGATKAERTRAYVLYGIAQLSVKNVSTARQAFRQALELSPAERVDSLEFLEPEDLLTVFNSERIALGPVPQSQPAPVSPTPAPQPAALTVELGLPADTVMPLTGGRLVITPKPSRAASTVVSVASPAAPAVPIWTDSLPAGVTWSLGWDLRGRDGALVPPGRYTVTATAVDSAGTSQHVRRTLVISRAAADTQPLPPALPRSAFLPEATVVSHRSATGLLLGAGLGAAAAMLPSVLGRPELNKGLGGDGTAYLVAGSVAIAGVIAFISGGSERHPLPDNVRRNAELRQQDAANRAAIAAANARALEAAPMRVRVEGGAP